MGQVASLREELGRPAESAVEIHHGSERALPVWRHEIGLRAEAGRSQVADVVDESARLDCDRPFTDVKRARVVLREKRHGVGIGDPVRELGRQRDQGWARRRRAQPGGGAPTERRRDDDHRREEQARPDDRSSTSQELPPQVSRDRLSRLSRRGAVALCSTGFACLSRLLNGSMQEGCNL